MTLIDQIEHNFKKLDGYSFVIKQNIFEINFNHNEIDFTLTVEKDLKYIFIESNKVKTDMINMDLLVDKNLNNVLSHIKYYNKTKEKSYVEKDIFGLFRDTKIFDKGGYNYDEIKRGMTNSNHTSDFSLSSIPKDIIYPRKQIIDILINEIKLVNRNKEFKHYITTTDFDYTFDIVFIFDTLDKLVLRIDFDPDLHPYYPPKIKFMEPNAKKEFIYHISNLSLLKVENWNPILSLSWLVENIAMTVEPLISEFILNCQDDVTQLDKDILDLSSLIGENPYSNLDIKLKYNKFTLKQSSSSDNKYWNSGVGYGYSGRNKWDISNFVKEKSNKNVLIVNKLNMIKHSINSDNIARVYSTPVMTYIKNTVCHFTLLEIDNEQDLFLAILNITEKIVFLTDDEDWLIQIYDGLSKISSDISPLVNTIGESQSDKNKLTNYITFITTSDKITEQIEELGIINKKVEQIESYNDVESNSKEQYSETITKEQGNIFTGYDIKSNHRFYKSINDKLNPKQLMRISSEFSSMKRNLPNNWDTSIVVRGSPNNMNVFSFVITGPKDTPYHNGIFEFHACFPQGYPESEPKVLLNTTGNGSVRFNPNLYACGKVCLSLLGTWQGENGESWNKDTSTFLQVLISIQSLILVEEPYYNEPGWERDMHTAKGKKRSFDYSDDIRYYTLKWAILDNMLNPPDGFEELSKKHFEFKKDEILETTKLWLSETLKHKIEMKELRNQLLEYYGEKKVEENSSSENETKDLIPPSYSDLEEENISSSENEDSNVFITDQSIFDTNEEEKDLDV